MSMKLFYAETLNPRKACAAAMYMKASVEFVHVDLGQGRHKEPAFLAINPNGKVPVLQHGSGSLWESNAIMCHLSDVTGADLWPHDARQIEVLRWLSWDMAHFTRHGGTLYFEYLIKPALGMGTPDAAAVRQATALFETSASLLDAHLRTRSFLVGETLSVADFAAGAALPYAERANIPLQDFPAIRRWYERMNELAAWREPFPARRPVPA
jgi:glutathione S-transferase